MLVSCPSMFYPVFFSPFLFASFLTYSSNFVPVSKLLKHMLVSANTLTVQLFLQGKWQVTNDISRLPIVPTHSYTFSDFLFMVMVCTGYLSKIYNLQLCHVFHFGSIFVGLQTNYQSLYLYSSWSSLDPLSKFD